MVAQNKMIYTKWQWHKTKWSIPSDNGTKQNDLNQVTMAQNKTIYTKWQWHKTKWSIPSDNGTKQNDLYQVTMAQNKMIYTKWQWHKTKWSIPIDNGTKQSCYSKKNLSPTQTLISLRCKKKNIFFFWTQYSLFNASKLNLPDWPTLWKNLTQWSSRRMRSAGTALRSFFLRNVSKSSFWDTQVM